MEIAVLCRAASGGSNASDANVPAGIAALVDHQREAFPGRRCCRSPGERRREKWPNPCGSGAASVRRVSGTQRRLEGAVQSDLSQTYADAVVAVVHGLSGEQRARYLASHSLYES